MGAFATLGGLISYVATDVLRKSAQWRRRASVCADRAVGCYSSATTEAKVTKWDGYNVFY